ncbi:hypothetical protein Droror1_Dr00018266 [Drosera rotundifolia]
MCGLGGLLWSGSWRRSGPKSVPGRDCWSVMWSYDRVQSRGGGKNTRELLCLLLSSYGATHSDVDLEIYSLMVEIESAEVGCGKLAELDFLWGSALLRTTRDEAHESDSLPYTFLSEIDEDSRRGHFKDNLPIDPKLCIETVLHFPFGRTTSLYPLSCEMFLQLNRKEPKIPTARGERIKCYDPVFILCFSIHCLSMDFLDSVEFAGLGLLAIALMSISSPDDNIRKLGYEVVGKFMDGLEKRRKKRDSAKLRLLLTYLQNGIQEPWQKIPSTITLFTSESSLILLDSSNDRHAAINKHLMQSSRINMEVILFFHDYFWSSSANFKKDRIWMLFLLCAGINSEEDFRLFIKGSVPEILLSFYVFPLSDNESKDLILQVIFHFVGPCANSPDFTKWYHRINKTAAGNVIFRGQINNAVRPDFMRKTEGRFFGGLRCMFFNLLA